MSSVRMCDRCGTVFSELADGWQAFQAATFKKDDEGRRISVPTMMDACPACAITPEEPATATRENDRFFAQRQLEGRNAELERELAAERARNDDEPAEDAAHEPVVPAPPPASA